MQIRFQTYEPWPELKGYIEKIWVFESSQPMPDDDMKLVVPNGRLLLALPFRNGIVGKMNNQYHFAKTGKMFLVGMSDLPSIVDAETNGPIGTIGVEISPMGAYRFFHFRLKEIKNQLYYLTDILNNSFKDIEEKLAQLQNVDDKVHALQEFLLSLFINGVKDSLFEYCTRQIEFSKGSVRIKELERQTGYTSRWLNLKFEERLGISPKGLSSIFRFQQYYRGILSSSIDFFRQKNFYDHYYDEAHFIKEFKRFTGLPPGKLIQLQNKFGKTFYQD